MNQYQNNKEFNDPSKGFDKINNFFKIIVLIILIVAFSYTLINMPKYNDDKLETAYNQVIDKLCGAAIKYTENNSIKRSVTTYK